MDRFYPRRMPSPYVVGPSFLHVFFAAIVIAVLVALAVWLVMSLTRTRQLPPPPHALPLPGPGDPALMEARIRYARGELTREQYLEIAGDLTGQPPPPPPPVSPPPPPPVSPPEAPPGE